MRPCQNIPPLSALSDNVRKKISEFVTPRGGKSVNSTRDLGGSDLIGADPVGYITSVKANSRLRRAPGSYSKVTAASGIPLGG